MAEKRRRGERLTRRETLLALSALFAFRHAPAAAETTKVPLIGRVSPAFASDPLHARVVRAFHDGMRALGHAEGRTYRFEARYAEGDPKRLPALVDELLRRDARVILAASTVSIRAARAATSDRPIIMAMSGIDPVRAGFATSLARPGGNVTGMTGLLEDMRTKHLELVREIVPGRPDVMVLHQPDMMDRQQAAEIVAMGEQLALKVRLAPIARAADLAPAFAAARGANAAGVVLLPAPAIMDRNRAHIAELALRYKLPTVAALREYAEAGALVAYGVDLADIYRRAAGYAAKILDGAKPADLPIEQPTKFELIVNLKTAKSLGLAIPPALLARADEVIE
jgi:putative ABC transport system substrate-binding protein